MAENKSSYTTNVTLVNNMPSMVVVHYYSTPPLWMRLMAVVCGTFVLAFGGFGNLTTLTAFAVNKYRTLWHRQYINIFCLASTDLIVCTYTCLNFIVKYASGQWSFSADYCRAFWAISTWAFISSLHSLVLVGNDRYSIVKHGADYERMETWQKMVRRTVLFALLWPLSTTPFLFMNYVTGTTVNAPGDCLPEFLQLGFVFPLMSYLSFCGPLGGMVFFYVKVYRYSHKRNGQLQQHSSSTKVITIPAVAAFGAPAVKKALPVLPQAAQVARQKRAARTLKYLFSSIIICHVPYFTVAIITTLVMMGAVGGDGGFFSDVGWWLQLLDLMQVTGWINNAINPLLYGYTMPRLHDAMVSVWKDAGKWILSASRIKKLMPANQ